MVWHYVHTPVHYKTQAKWTSFSGAVQKLSCPRYSREENRIWADFRHGLFLGSQKFVDDIRSKYLSEKPDVEIPQKRYVLRVADPKTIREKAAKVLRCNTNDFLQSARICDSGKLNRALLIYLLWSTGWYNNQEVGTLFGLGYSSISRPSIYRCIDMALSRGIEAGLKDKYHRAKDPIITEQAKAWITNLACSKPKEHGLASEIWSLKSLAKHTRKHASEAGHTV